MNNLKQILLVAMLGSVLGVSAQAQTATPGAQPAPHTPAAAASATAPADLTEGEIRKVDKSAGKLTVKHGEIRNLDMPPMTMVFGVSDAALLGKVKQGDKVRFRAARLDGKFTITEIEPVR